MMIMLFTGLVYAWLKRKNWIGSLLQFPNQVHNQKRLEKQRKKKK